MFNNDALRAAVTKANCALDFTRRIVAVKFLFTREEFEKADAPRLTSKMRYCGMIDRANRGEKLKADFDTFGCFGGARALGIVERDEFYQSGRFFQPRGLYQDLATSREVTGHIASCQHRAYGIQVMPVEDFCESPDVVIIVTQPKNIMRLVQGYTYHYGTHKTYQMIGNQALCAECTALPFETNDVNISVLCAGPRSVGMNDSEMAMGLPFNRFETVVDGLCATITPVETNNVKLSIIEKFKSRQINDVPVLLNRNYGMPFFKRDYAYFSQQRDRKPLAEESLLPDIWQTEE